MWIKQVRNGVKILFLANPQVMLLHLNQGLHFVLQGVRPLWKCLLIINTICIFWFSSVQFSRSVMSDSLWPHGLQHARLPCPSPTPGACSNSCLLSQWYHPTISTSVIPSPLAFNLSQHQGLFQWLNSSHQVAKVLEFQLQYQSFQWTPRTDLH